MTERTCPLGHTCDQCLWEVETQKTNPATQEIAVIKNCAIVESVLAQVATFQQTHSVGAAIESTRNAMLERRPEPRLIG